MDSIAFFQISEILSPQKHGNLKFRCLGADCPMNCCQRARKTYVNIDEVPRLSCYFPITFPYVKEKDGSMKLSMMLHYALETAIADVDDPNGCAYLDPDRGCTIFKDRPRACKEWPVGPAIDAQEKNKTYFRLDLSCPGLNEIEGYPLYDENDFSKWFEDNFVKYAVEYASFIEADKRFLDTIEKLKILTPWEIKHRGITVKVNVPNPQRIASLPDRTKTELIRNGYMYIMFVCLNSLHKFYHLIDAYLDRKKE